MNRTLKVKAVIGYSGRIDESLILHPNNQYVIYPIGSTVVVRHIQTKQQYFLRGHTNKVSAITISPNGKYIASAIKTFAGFHAEIIIWDFESRKMLRNLKLHKVEVKSLSFSYHSHHLASQGGHEDKNILLIWDVDTGKSLYGAPNEYRVYKICYFNGTDNKLIALTSFGLQIITIDKFGKSIDYRNFQLGSLKKQFTCLTLDFKDVFCYAGTKNGSFAEIHLESETVKRIGPTKKLFSSAITIIKYLQSKDILIGSADGKLAKVAKKTLLVIAQAQLIGGITSISFTKDESHFYCGTNYSNLYKVNTTNLSNELLQTAHQLRINDLVFPPNYSDVIATCASNNIRLWNLATRQELLRIQIVGLECNVINFLYDGSSLISGWSDGKIRSFLPESGKLVFMIKDAHLQGVTAIQSTGSCEKIVSGGYSGEVRVWSISKKGQTLEANLKSHRSRIWSVNINNQDSQAASVCGEGMCTIWDLKKYTQIIVFRDNTMLKQVILHREGFEVLTGTSDGRVIIWEKYDGSKKKQIQSSSGQINSLVVSKYGEWLLVGGEDSILRLYQYQNMNKPVEGIGHSEAITKIQMSPNEKTIVSVGHEGGIFIWELKEQQKVELQSPLKFKRKETKPGSPRKLLELI